MMNHKKVSKCGAKFSKKETVKPEKKTRKPAVKKIPEIEVGDFADIEDENIIGVSD